VFITLVTTAFVVFLAELGDKTQLMCMALVAKYGVRQVFAGAASAAVLNTALAVLMGEGLTRVIPLSTLQLLAGLGFLAFGFWTMRQGEREELCPRQTTSGRHPFWTVFLAFFVAEFGDKTQLVTIGLVAKFDTPLLMWLGASFGLVAAQLVGISMSGWLSKRLPPHILQVGAAIMFLAFGSLTLYQSVPGGLRAPMIMLTYVAMLGLTSSLLMRKQRRL